MVAKQKIKQAGFSLIELSVWITLIAIFMSTMLSWLTPAAVEEADKITITNKRLDKIEQALENFRVRYGRIPCPAKSTLADTDGEAYREYCVTVRTALSSTTENIGAVPVKSLGLQLEDGLDGWGRRFTYHVSKQICDVDDSDATNPPACSSTDPCGEIRNCTPTRFRCGPSAGGDYTSCGGSYSACVLDPTASCETGDLSIYKYVSGVASAISSKAAYVIVSHGPDGQCAYMSTGSQRDLGTGCTPAGTASAGQDENYFTYGAQTSGQVNDKIWFTDAYGTSVDSSTYDDIVRYKTKSQIEARTLDTYSYVLPKNPVTSPTKIGCTDTVTTAANTDSVYEALNYYNTTVETNINAGITYFSSTYPTTASDHYLAMLWTMQEICYAYYGSVVSSPYARVCPNGKTYYSTYHGCCTGATCP